MKKLLILMAIIVVLAILQGCNTSEKSSNNSSKGNENMSMLATPENKVLSPSSKYRLAVVSSKEDAAESWSFIIEDATSNNVVYKSSDGFRTRDTIYILWGEQDRVWVYSGDIGTFIWTHENNQWVKKSFVDTTGITPPDLLKELRPKYFK